MKELLGYLLILSGIILGVWLGVWILFIGGIVQIVEAIKSNPVSAIGIAIGILKVISSGFVGWVSGIVVSSIGVGLLK